MGAHMGCSTLAHEQSSNCHLNTFLWIIYGNCAWHFTLVLNWRRGAQWVHKKVKFFSHYCTQKCIIRVWGRKKTPNTFFLACAVIGYTMNTDWIICLILNGPMVVLLSHLFINHCLVMRMFFLMWCLLTLGRHEWTLKNVASRPHPHKTQVGISIDLENVASPPPTQDTSGDINRPWKCCIPTTPPSPPPRNPF